MDLQRHIAAIIRRHPNQADYCAERIVKLVEKNFTSTNNARDEMPPSCTECWVIGCQFDYNGVGCRNQVGAARSPVA